ncbi:retropepsin-like aspartic protease family protein [Terrarubrum flagellatum]|uniref:retropepsin-like aspartic protease family protein n=1 Tax=Terrirubrum flagellatum TaxID=2895980 RepID=UPI003144E455
MDFVKSVIGVSAALMVGAVMVVREMEAQTPSREKGGATSVAIAKQSEAAPTPSRASGFGAVSLPPGPGGHYHANVEIDGRRLPMLVDTGASVVALTLDDARSIGVDPSPSDYTIPLATANGMAKGARVMLREVRIENISARDVAAVVLPRGVTGRSLLGMSFLSKLRGFEVVDGKMLLKP